MRLRHEAERAVQRDRGLVGGVDEEHPDGDAAPVQPVQAGDHERAPEAAALVTGSTPMT